MPDALSGNYTEKSIKYSTATRITEPESALLRHILLTAHICIL